MSHKISCNLINKLLKSSFLSELTATDLQGIVNEIVQQKFPSHLRNGLKTFDDKFDRSKDIRPTKDDVWIFGYGSLVWKADFPYIARRSGYIHGFERRFYQHSIDHRGVPAAPGRVVTLIQSADARSRVYGVAYRIASSQKTDVLEHLDYREKNGYERRSLAFHPFATEDEPLQVIMYIAAEENESYAGHIPDLDDIAQQIFHAAGASGPNREYLYRLAMAMRSHFPGVDDEHLFGLEAKVRQMEIDEFRAKVTEVLKNAESDEDSLQKLIGLVEDYKKVACL